MDIWLYLSLSGIVGICLSIYAYAIECSKFNHIELSLSNLNFVKLYLLRAIHFGIFIFYTLYLFFVDISIKNDIIIAGLIVLIFLHWLVLGGCILTILEKRLLFPNGINYPEKMPFLSLLNVPEVITDIPDEVILILALLLVRRIYIAKYVNIRI
jgi:hypothetical protein